MTLAGVISDKHIIFVSDKTQMMLRRLLGGGSPDRRALLQQEYEQEPEEENEENVRERIHNKLMLNRELNQDTRMNSGETSRSGIYRASSGGSGTGTSSFVTASISARPLAHLRSSSEGATDSRSQSRPQYSRSRSSDSDGWEQESTDYDGIFYEAEGQSKYYQDVDGYLTEQNRKFNQLIDKNLNYVAHNNLTDIYKEPNQTGMPLFESGGNYDNDEYNLILMDKFLMNLDDSNKLKLYQKLSQEFSPTNRMLQYSLFNEDKSYIKTLTLFEKCELVMILMIKLNFLLIKYSVPITKKLYNKFVNNQIYLLNNDNFNRLLNLTIKLLNNLENNYYSKQDTDMDMDSLNEEIRGQIDQLDQWNLATESNSRFSVNLNPIKVVGIIYNYYRGGTTDLDLLNAAEAFVNQM